MPGTFIFIGALGGGGGSAGDVIGPVTSTDNALVRWDGATGIFIKDSGVILDDLNVMTVPSITASRAVVTSALQALVASVTTAAELAFVSGVTSSIQDQLDDKVPLVVSTDNAVVRFDGTGGDIQNSGVLINDANTLSTPGSLIAGATGAAVASASIELRTVTGALLLSRLTAVQIGALTGVNGMIVYNTDTDRFQGFAAGAWLDLHGWGS